MNAQADRPKTGNAAGLLLELALDFLEKDWPDDFEAIPQETLIRDRNMECARLHALIRAAHAELTEEEP
jgi:hypothetical protein